MKELLRKESATPRKQEKHCISL